MEICAIDLFCGIGGLTNGLIQAGIRVCAGIDNDASCAFPYEANNNAIFINEDICNVDHNTINNYLYKADVKIVVGCAPCQPFSKYSSRYRKTGYRDDKWKLLKEFERIVAESSPDIISMENVPNLIDTEIFQSFVQDLKKYGYYVSYSIVNCLNYGLPQRRKRLVLLASKFGNITLLPPTHKQVNYRTVRDAIGDLPKIEAGEVYKNDPLHQSSKLSPINLKRIRCSQPGGTWRTWDESLKLNCHGKDSGKTFPSVYGRMEWDKPSPTITTQFFGYGNGRFGHPEQDRAISLREGAILQSFPNDYIFFDKNHKDSKRNIAMHIGNAVPVILGKVIGDSIISHIKEYVSSDPD